MTQYLYTLPILFMTLLCMLFLTVTNEYILTAHKKAFFVVFLGAFFITVCEVLSIFLNGAELIFKPIHFLANYLGFLLTPLLITFFATSIGRFHRFKGAVIAMAAYCVIYNILVATKHVFFIDAQNIYHRSGLYSVYIISYVIAMLYLFYETLRYSRKGFLQHKIFAYLLGICFLLSSSVQVFNPEIYITRITVVVGLCMYYAYNIELTNLFDNLTGVLNQGTYIRKIKDLKKHQYVIIMDIDDFKYINDNYGHQYGNKCLKALSKSLKSTFGNNGQCYRIGGDEFAVILKKSSNAEALISRFEQNVDDRFENMPYKLSVSLGYSKYQEGDSYESVVSRADAAMYNVKNQKKALKMY